MSKVMFTALACGILTFGTATLASAQDYTIPAGDALAMTPPIDQRPSQMGQSVRAVPGLREGRSAYAPSPAPQAPPASAAQDH